jgi:hypothetical protein
VSWKVRSLEADGPERMCFRLEHEGGRITTISGLRDSLVIRQLHRCFNSDGKIHPNLASYLYSELGED